MNALDHDKPRTEADLAALRSASFRPQRRHWPGVLAAALIGAGIAALAVSSYYDSRSIGQRIDASVGEAEKSVQSQVDGIKAGAAEVANRGAEASERLTGTLADASITAAVKTALAADPALSALKIDVDTHDGVVMLSGPAPDERARERAAVLAAAPAGVRTVDNRLVVTTPAAKPG